MRDRAATAALTETIELQRVGCELAGSALYARILGAMAANVAAGGPIGRLLAPVAHAPLGDAVLLRLLAGLHRLVLEGRAPALAAHYPSAGGRPGPDLEAAVTATVEGHGAELSDRLQEGVQTNEVGRSASMLGGYLEVARLALPLRVLEVGASAGLNLLFDRYRYTAGEASFGPASSDLTFEDPWLAAAPDLATPMTVAERRGSDLAPIDVADPLGCVRLRSFVWADQLDRLGRLDAAIRVAQADPPPLDRAGASAWLASQLAAPTPGRSTVVTHSIMFQYLSERERADMVAVIEDAGARASADAPVAWLRLEPAGDQAELRLTSWPGGRPRRLATSAFHGPPVAWLAPHDGGHPSAR